MQIRAPRRIKAGALLGSFAALIAVAAPATAAPLPAAAGVGSYTAALGDVQGSLIDQQIIESTAPVFSYTGGGLINKIQTTGIINFGTDAVNPKLVVVATRITLTAGYPAGTTKAKKVTVGCRHWISHGTSYKWLGPWMAYTLDGAGSSVRFFGTGGVNMAVSGIHDVGLRCRKVGANGWSPSSLVLPALIKSNYAYIPLPFD